MIINESANTSIYLGLTDTNMSPALFLTYNDD